jgi:hypothetical protein
MVLTSFPSWSQDPILFPVFELKIDESPPFYIFVEVISGDYDPLAE